jgi:immune inhibitor A
MTEKNQLSSASSFRDGRVEPNHVGQNGRCLVAPSPELRERIKEELATLHDSSSELMGTMLRAQPHVPIGMNDGLIYPGDTFPPGTSPEFVASAAARRAPPRGTVRVIVVLAEFSDRSFNLTSQDYEDLFFSTGTLPNGSVKEYFTEVSGGLVDIVGEVVGPYQMPLSMAQYANSAFGTGQVAPNARTMARDAAELANPDVDFSLYDNDADNFVDAFIILHAGPGGESTGNAGHIWSHKWVLSGGAFSADGTNIFAYLTVPEDSKIGVCCHELGHLLFGFPDLYDTDYTSEGVGNWCLMGGGSWLGGGEIPAHPSAWCKVQQGWVSVTEPLQERTYQLEDVKQGRSVFRLWRNATPGQEYFLVENRQKLDFDRELPAEGLLIWHVDDSIADNSNEIHPKVALVQADGRGDLESGNNRGDASDPYPGSTGNQSFTSDSDPSSDSYGGHDTCVQVEQISAPGATMTAVITTRCEADENGCWEMIRKWLRSIFGSG